MGKKRVYEFAKEMHVDNKDVLDIAKNLGIEVKNHMSSIDQDQEAKIKGVLGKSAAAKAPATSAAAKPAKSKAASAKIMLRTNPKSRSSMKTSLLSLTKLLMEKSF